MKFGGIRSGPELNTEIGGNHRWEMSIQTFGLVDAKN
jgi:hypothetical protein